MPKYLSEQPLDICSRRMITMDVYKTDSTNYNPLVVEVCLMDADRTAREFSKLVAVANGRVQLMQDARVRAIYKNGERIQQSDMRDFYEMSDEEYAESKILCSVKHEYF